MSANWKSEEAKFFDNLVTRHGDYCAFSRKEYERILSSFRFKGLVLELGCATAAFGRHMPGDIVVVGIDVSLKSLRIAKAFEQVILGDAENAPFRDNSFDVVFCGHVLHHLVDIIEPVLAEIWRILKPDGTVLVVEANANIYHKAIKLYARLRKMHTFTSKEKLITVSELYEMFDRANFKSKFWVESHQYRSSKTLTYRIKTFLSLLLARMFPYLIMGVARKKTDQEEEQRLWFR